MLEKPMFIHMEVEGE
ncbi:Protein of unknown function [Bacillus cereus]|uniref:Uncharacterized protein n=1 Tax=Bacillus wiedmannii TaxID=1890302 RepID=A0A1C4D1R8_9BACI|nr:Protein of unknown function [Bacillus wiedmannii]SCC28974.1 Protein of unknown function [Bacillus cereus]SCN03699.1 Protein of unknown function [Bacillus wiedmannii]SCN44179.1 Protein of unknown function [Bacillus wiedmannii]